MSSVTLSSRLPAPMVVSRPKIHRLPVPSARPYNKKPSSFKIVALGTAILVVSAFLPNIDSQQFDLSQKTKLITAILPQISISPQNGSQSDTASIVSNATNALSNTIGEAQADIGTPVSNIKPVPIISLHSKSEYIVGQMAKIPVENEQITEIKSANDIDNHAGRELLSIISKY